MTIDSHQHFWRIADRRGQWPPSTLTPIRRDFEPADLQPALRACGVAGTVLVQLASPGAPVFLAGAPSVMDLRTGGYTGGGYTGGGYTGGCEVGGPGRPRGWGYS